MTFEEFKDFVEQALASGLIKIDVELDELDLAIQYAIGQEIHSKGVEVLYLKDEDIQFLIIKWCGLDVYERVFGKE